MLHAGYISGVGQTELLDWEALCRCSPSTPRPTMLDIGIASSLQERMGEFPTDLSNSLSLVVSCTSRHYNKVHAGDDIEKGHISIGWQTVIWRFSAISADLWAVINTKSTP